MRRAEREREDAVRTRGESRAGLGERVPQPGRRSRRRRECPPKPKQQSRARPHGMRGRGGERGVAQREGTQVARQHESRRSRGGAAGEGERRRVPQQREGVVGGGAWPKAAVAAQRRERDASGAAARARPTLPSSSPPHGSRPTECLREERRSSQRAGEGRVGSARARRSRGTASRQHTPAHSRERVSSHLGRMHGRRHRGWTSETFCSGLPSDGAMSGVGPPARRARHLRGCGSARPARRMPQRGRRRGVAVHAVLRW